MIGMDGSVSVGLTGTLMGTAIGGGLSIWASVVAQNRQAKATRDLRIEEKAEAAAEEAITQLYVIKQRAWDLPQDNSGFGAWDQELSQLAVQMEPTVLRIRNKELRERIEEVLGYMGMTHELTDHPVHGGSLLLPWMVCSYGLECLGAAVRGEPLPELTEPIHKARAIDAHIREQRAVALFTSRDSGSASVTRPR
ncbi:hypothetical protein [Streptomyces sp. NPDC058295]|uniref:hypothetical protein n=1 Tax=Streptomyces sp. NPDC058295 TaxID=3346431 RepID=UPI0036EBF269